MIHTMSNMSAPNRNSKEIRGEPETPDYIVEWVFDLIREDRIHDFYRSRIWRNKSLEVRRRQKECQEHKRLKSYVAPQMVHHVMPLKQHPQLALSDYYLEADGTKRVQLEAECHACHERLERRDGSKTAEKFPERW